MHYKEGCCHYSHLIIVLQDVMQLFHHRYLAKDFVWDFVKFAFVSSEVNFFSKPRNLHHSSKWVVNVNQKYHYNLLQKWVETICQELHMCREDELPLTSIVLLKCHTDRAT